MSLARFSVIAAVDTQFGLSKNGVIPWNCKDDRIFFRTTTQGPNGSRSNGVEANVMIMGRKTYESFPHTVTDTRIWIVVSSTLQKESHPDVTVVPSLLAALTLLGPRVIDGKRINDVFVIGGTLIYREAIERYLYLCDRIIISFLESNYDCDSFMPIDLIRKQCGLSTIDPRNGFTIETWRPQVRHPEEEYLGLIRRVLSDGEQVNGERTGVGTISIFGERMVFDLRHGFPILTTKKVAYRTAFKELLWMLSGSTDSKQLEADGIKIWSGNSSREFLDRRGLSWQDGDIGPGYGFQWRSWGATYTGCSTEYGDKGIDQIQGVIESIKTDKFSRRHVVSAWNVSDLDAMALPPCHLLFQFSVSGDGTYLDCGVYLRSNDLFLGAPFNIANYGLLMSMVAHLTKLMPRKLVLNIGNAHLYQNTLDQVKLQLSRTPLPWPQLKFVDPDTLTSIDSFTIESISLVGYESWPAISAPMAI